MEERTTIFVVEDNALIRDAVVEYFELNDYRVVAFARAEGVVSGFHTQQPHAVILDVMLPDGSGFAIAREIRAHSDVPILFLTARDAESHRVMGFEIGGDDYIVKPFSVKELLLRTEAVLRRSLQPAPLDSQVGRWTWSGHALVVDRDRRVVTVDDEPLTLTNAEWEILTYLATHAERAISRAHILENCLGYRVPSSERTVDTHIASIRTSLGDPRWIETVRGFGYRFVGVVAAASLE